MSFPLPDQSLRHQRWLVIELVARSVFRSIRLVNLDGFALVKDWLEVRVVVSDIELIEVLGQVLGGLLRLFQQQVQL